MLEKILKALSEGFLVEKFSCRWIMEENFLLFQGKLRRNSTTGVLPKFA